MSETISPDVAFEVGELSVVIPLAFLIVLLVAGSGFTLHFLWSVAAVFFSMWLVGFTLGRGQGAGATSLLPVVKPN